MDQINFGQSIMFKHMDLAKLKDFQMCSKHNDALY